ncbi:MAG: hemerythrin domain-containing protein [Candidatus Thiodiazotropha taylori]|uniref:Hypoxanthine phosphoribosyltransferase n=3 Tax=Candidatus Thiodiazotropha TaxID=1913444 RepID=A0A1E2UTL9_9GAMM|nr:hemerythrin domain-containing protein [Candidatus Thiodiazotropha taylori]MCG8017857.1 hemerythrin domain-containing protein [Candidatus Thiodiazotropha sp. 'RUGA']ODB85062.1 hypoxanthine phosphoribosyltransferase [Candidatus Thiodiazotropha endoloripes]RLW52217.1 MAG: hypoxanthine phosphoribosyltransferase [gamma proteobacterium symbiont of Stewartia floridana]MCG7894210.1 hemerythrin domain-containing protein [Candidatus Thiodiazotropha taylori]
MSTLESMKGSHTDMQQIISDLRAMMTREQLSIRPNAMTTHKMICDLAEMMKGHMSDQDRGVYPDLLTHQDPKLKSMAWGFLNGQKPIRKQFERYHNKWLKNCDFNFSDEFIAETFEIFDMIEDRIQREETILIPTLEKSGVFAQAV